MNKRAKAWLWVVCCLVGFFPMAARATVTHEHFRSPLQGSSYVDCANEVVSYEGRFQVRLTTVTTHNGDILEHTVSVFQHVTGMGQTTGDTYRYISNGFLIEHQSDGDSRLTVARNSTAFVSAGGDGSQTTTGLTRIIENGLGERVVEDHRLLTTCR